MNSSDKKSISSDRTPSLSSTQSTSILLELLESFDSKRQFRPMIFSQSQVKEGAEARRKMMELLDSAMIATVLPGIYRCPGWSVNADSYAEAPYQIAIALAEQKRWNIVLPYEFVGFFFGKRSRPESDEIHTFFFDQPNDVSVPEFDLRFKPLANRRVFEAHPICQAIILHAQLQPSPTKEELFEDAKFAASSWFRERLFIEPLIQNLKDEKFTGDEIFLAKSILFAAQKLDNVIDQAPANFDPRLHAASAARIFGWTIELLEDGNHYLRADRIENHAHIRDGAPLSLSTALVWFDLKLGWARTRSRFYRLEGPSAP